MHTMNGSAFENHEVKHRSSSIIQYHRHTYLLKNGEMYN